VFCPENQRLLLQAYATVKCFQCHYQAIVGATNETAYIFGKRFHFAMDLMIAMNHLVICLTEKVNEIANISVVFFIEGHLITIYCLGIVSIVIIFGAFFWNQYHFA
jgi:hypothetical protein